MSSVPRPHKTLHKQNETSLPDFHVHSRVDTCFKSTLATVHASGVFEQEFYAPAQHNLHVCL